MAANPSVNNPGPMLCQLNDQMGTGITYMAHLQELMCILNLMLDNLSSAKAAQILIIILVCGVLLRSKAIRSKVRALVKQRKPPSCFFHFFPTSPLDIFLFSTRQQIVSFHHFIQMLEKWRPLLSGSQKESVPAGTATVL